jgi:hypothetical protein
VSPSRPPVSHAVMRRSGLYCAPGAHYGNTEAVTGAGVEHHRGAANLAEAWEEPRAWAIIEQTMPPEGAML